MLLSLALLAHSVVAAPLVRRATEWAKTTTLFYVHPLGKDGVECFNANNGDFFDGAVVTL